MFTALGVGFMRLLAHLPLTWVRGLGTALGWVLYGVVPARRRVVQVNLALCCPDTPQADRHRCLLYPSPSPRDQGEPRMPSSA